MMYRRKSLLWLTIKIVILAAGIALTNHEVLLRLTYYLDFQLYFPLSVFGGIWILTLLSLLYVAFTSNQGARTFWVIMIGISTLLGETWFQLTGSQISIASLDEMTERLALTAVNRIENPDAAGLQLTGFFNSPLLIAALATALLAAGLLMQPKPQKFLQSWVMGLLPVFPFGLLIALVFYTAATHGNETRGMPGQFHSLALITAYAFSEKPSHDKAGIDIPLTGSPLARHIVLIVDESVSGDYIDLNIQRGSTPFLNSVNSGAMNFGLAISASNCSNASNAVLRLGANPAMLGVPGQSIINNPSIWKYAAAAGFETSYINAQSVEMQRQNYMNQVELGLIDHLPTVSQVEPRPNHDYQALEYLQQVLSREDPQFVYLNKRGVYSPYYSSYPEAEEVFTPSLRQGDEISDRESLVNTYMNAIRWSVDGFFRSLVTEMEAKNYVIIYTSDHGQNLLDDGMRTAHCRRNHQNLFEGVVPLLVWTDVERLRRRYEDAVIQNRNQASHFQIFPSLLVMMGYEKTAVTRRYYESLFDPVSLPLGFTSGPVMGRFGAKPDWISRQGLENLSRE